MSKASSELAAAEQLSARAQGASGEVRRRIASLQAAADRAAQELKAAEQALQASACLRL